MKAVTVYAIVGVFTFLTAIPATAGYNDQYYQRGSSHQPFPSPAIDGYNQQQYYPRDSSQQAHPIPATGGYNQQYPRGSLQQTHPLQTSQEWLREAYNDLSDELEQLKNKLMEIARKLQDEIRQVIECEHNVVNTAIADAENFLNDAKQCIYHYVPVIDWLQKVKEAGKKFVSIMDTLFDEIPRCSRNTSPGARIFDRATEALKCMTRVLNGATEQLTDFWDEATIVYDESETLMKPEVASATTCLADNAKGLMRKLKDASVKTYQCLQQFNIPDV